MADNESSTEGQWTVGGALVVAGATTLGDDVAVTGNGVISGNLNVGQGSGTYLTDYNWFAVDGDGFKTYGEKFWDFDTGAYRLMYVRNGFLEGDGVTGLATSDVVRPFFPGCKAGASIEGGFCVQLKNKTGAVSIKGTVVGPSHTTDMAFGKIPADDPDPIGAVYEDGVPDGGECWIATHGIIEQLMQNTTETTHGYWVKVSDTVDGRADAANAAPPGGTINAITDHFTETGHSLQSLTYDTDQLLKTIGHQC